MLPAENELSCIFSFSASERRARPALLCSRCTLAYARPSTLRPPAVAAPELARRWSARSVCSLLSDTAPLAIPPFPPQAPEHQIFPHRVRDDLLSGERPAHPRPRRPPPLAPRPRNCRAPSPAPAPAATPHPKPQRTPPLHSSAPLTADAPRPPPPRRRVAQPPIRPISPQVFDVPVFWPILLLYWLMLLFVTMKRQIRHMIKHRYLPFTWGKQARVFPQRWRAAVMPRWSRSGALRRRCGRRGRDGGVCPRALSASRRNTRAGRARGP